MKREQDLNNHPDTRSPLAFRQYYSLEKRLADSEAFDLLVDCGDSFSAINTAYYQHLGGWAYAEAALIANGEHDTYDKLDLLDEAQDSWEQAHRLELLKYNIYEEELRDHDIRSSDLLHIETSMAAGNVFAAMVEKDITPEVRQNYYDDLLTIAAHANNGLKAHMDKNGWERDGNYIGFAHELNAMLVINRIMSPTLMAFPALPRSDSGVNFPRQTHDISLLNMKWGEIQRALPIEVKTTPQDIHFERYDSVIVGGTMHMHPENQRDPSYLTELLIKESLDLSNNEEQAVLGNITERIIHTARHGFGDISQCRDIDNCNDIPLKRNTNKIAS